MKIAAKGEDLPLPLFLLTLLLLIIIHRYVHGDGGARRSLRGRRAPHTRSYAGRGHGDQAGGYESIRGDKRIVMVMMMWMMMMMMMMKYGDDHDGCGYPGASMADMVDYISPALLNCSSCSPSNDDHFLMMNAECTGTTHSNNPSYVPFPAVASNCNKCAALCSSFLATVRH